MRKIFTTLVTSCCLCFPALAGHTTEYAIDDQVHEILFKKAGDHYPELEDLLADTDEMREVEVELLKNFFDLDDDDNEVNDEIKSHWQQCREYLYGEEGRPLTLRERMHVLAFMIHDFFTTLKTFVQYEIRLLQEEIGDRFNSIWHYFSHQVEDEEGKKRSLVRSTLRKAADKLGLLNKEM